MIVSAVPTTARADVGVVTSAGRLLRLTVIDLPMLPDTSGAPSLVLDLSAHPVGGGIRGERALCLKSALLRLQADLRAGD